MSQVKKAHKALAEKRLKLAKIPVELQVRDTEHARSAEVIEFCIAHLTGGGTWEELRARLGLGPAHQDYRWRKLKELLIDGLAPKTEEEALKAQADGRAYLLSKVQEFEETLDQVLLVMGNSAEEKKSLPSLLKLKMDAIKMQLDENARGFDAYVNLKKAKEADKKTQGVSILIQNNFHMPRPGDDKKELKDVTAVAVGLLDAKRSS
jgi:hypothetical protein